jgi:hypothetical protein
MNPNIPIDANAYTIPKYPNILFPENVDITWLIIPNPGIINI